MRPGRGPRGRGVFAACDIPAGTVLERCAVVVLPRAELETGVLLRYVFLWGPGQDQYALPTGCGLLYNHDPRPNTAFETDESAQEIVFRSLTAVAAGDELLVDYEYGKEHLAEIGHPDWYRPAR